jgi:hypothetical protein
MSLWSRARPVRWTHTLTAICKMTVDNVGSLTTHNPTGLHGRVWGQFYLITCSWWCLTGNTHKDLHIVHASSGAHPVSHQMGIGALSPGVKRPGREGQGNVDLYINSPPTYTPSWLLSLAWRMCDPEWCSDILHQGFLPHEQTKQIPRRNISTEWPPLVGEM